MIKAVTLLIFGTTLLVGCSDNASYPSSAGKPKPYILKTDCKFTIVAELSKTGITSPKVSGMDGVTASASISLEGKSITVSNCVVIENSHALPIYED